MSRFRMAAVVLLSALAVSGCGTPGDVPYTLLTLVDPPARLIGQCQDSLRRVRGPQLACRSANARAEWLVRVDSASRVLVLARSSRVGRGRVSAVVDSARTAIGARLGPGQPCDVGYGHLWQGSTWTTFVLVREPDAAGIVDTTVNVILTIARSPDIVPC